MALLAQSIASSFASQTSGFDASANHSAAVDHQPLLLAPPHHG
jgi:hypothetical protein